MHKKLKVFNLYCAQIDVIDFCIRYLTLEFPAETHM